MSPEVAVQRSITRAERILPGKPAPEGKRDPRWLAIIRVGDFIETQPEAVWLFAYRWGKHAQADLRMAVATCLLEHLLEHHFDLLFPRVRKAVFESRRFAGTFDSCWMLGESELPKNAARFTRLKRELRRQGNRKAAAALAALTSTSPKPPGRPMPSKSNRPTAGPATKVTKATIREEVDAVVALLKQSGTKVVRDGMARYGIPSEKALGVSVGDLKKLAKRLGRNHELAGGLWESGWYEARMLAAFVDEPARVTPGQMERWCQDFDNWAICDSVCFHLFDRTPHAWKKVTAWSARRDEFVKRASFALLWGLTVHDKQAGDDRFAEGLLLIERAATDERHFVKKAVNMALRAVGKRNARLRGAAISVAKRLADSGQGAARWVGKDALRELTGVAAL